MPRNNFSGLYQASLTNFKNFSGYVADAGVSTDAADPTIMMLRSNYRIVNLLNEPSDA